MVSVCIYEKRWENTLEFKVYILRGFFVGKYNYLGDTWDRVPDEG
jgi:hypothetical protein